MGYVDSDAFMFVAVVALVGYLCWLYHKKQQQQTELKRMQMQLFDKTLEKFGNAGEFVTFMQGKEGQALLFNGKTPERIRSRTVLRFAQAGSLLAVMAIGFFVTAQICNNFPGPDARDMYIGFNIFGMVVASLGVGLFVVALITRIWEKSTGSAGNA
jgi:hypothetical protein